MVKLLIVITVLFVLGIMFFSWEISLIGLGCLLALSFLFAIPFYFFSFLNAYLQSKSVYKAHQSGMDSGSEAFGNAVSEIDITSLNLPDINIDL